MPAAASASVPSVPLQAEPFAGALTTPFSWSGSPWSLAPLCLMNAVLGLLTLGVYSFWGRNEVRRRIWSSVRLLDEPFAYLGTARELLVGFFSVLLALLVPLFLIGGAVSLTFGPNSGALVSYQFLTFLVIYPILTAVAYYRARRYRLSRTAWRGIRASMDGSSGEYGLLSWGLALAYPVTLGWIAPYRAVVLQRALASETQLGAEPLRFEGSAWSLYGRFALLWFGSIVLLLIMLGAIRQVLPINIAHPAWWALISGRQVAGVLAIIAAAAFVWSILSSFYYAGLYNLCAGATHFGRSGALGIGPHRFRLDVKGRELIWLFVTNSMITYLSLYILKPVATARSLKYYAERLSVVGPFDPAQLGQNSRAIDQSGEGLGQAFDLDAF